MTALRSRNIVPPTDRKAVHTADDDQSVPTPKPKIYFSDSDEGPNRLSLLDVLRVLGGLFLLSGTLSYFITGNSILWGYRPAVTRPARIKAWLVRNLPFKFFFPMSRRLMDRLYLARSLRSDRRPIIHIQRH